MRKHFILKSSAFAVLAILSSQAVLASGYHFGAQSVAGVSVANANGAEAADASTIFHNPAGLTHLQGAQITGNLILVTPSVKYSNAQGRYFATRTPIQGTSGGKISDDTVLVPQLYASYQLNDRVATGIGIYIPFASGTEYQMDSVLRYNVNQTKLTTFDINPTLAFKISDKHSIGVGVIAQYTDAKLRQFADFAPGLKKAGLPVASGQADGYADVKGNDWGYGYNLGWLWDVTDNVRIGVNYRSKVKHTLRGTGQWHLEGAAFRHPQFGGAASGGVRNLGYVADEDVSVKVITPESLSLHTMWAVNPKWNVFGDVTWTRHARFDILDINWQNKKMVTNGENPLSPTPTLANKTTLRPNWKNTWKFAIGGSYQITEPLQLRAGLSYDQAPVRSDNDRLSTMPDNDRITLGLGAKYDLNKNSSLNLAYAYMRVKNARANVNGWCGGSVEMGPGAKSCVSSRTSGSANFKSDAHIFGVQYTYKF